MRPPSMTELTHDWRRMNSSVPHERLSFPKLQIKNDLLQAPQGVLSRYTWAVATEDSEWRTIFQTMMDNSYNSHIFVCEVLHFCLRTATIGTYILLIGHHGDPLFPKGDTAPVLTGTLKKLMIGDRPILEGRRARPVLPGLAPANFFDQVLCTSATLPLAATLRSSRCHSVDQT
jgi:hypothetical protein